MPFISTHLQPYIYIYNQTSKFSGIVLRSGSYNLTFTFTSEPLSIHINLDLKQNFWYIHDRVFWPQCLSDLICDHSYIKQLFPLSEYSKSSAVCGWSPSVLCCNCFYAVSQNTIMFFIFQLSSYMRYIFKVCSKKSKIVRKTKNQILHRPRILSIIFNYIFGKTKNYILCWTQKHREGLCSVM